MKLSDVVYKTYEEVAEMPRFDLAKRTRKTSQFVKPL